MTVTVWVISDGGFECLVGGWYGGVSRLSMNVTVGTIGAEMGWIRVDYIGVLRVGESWVDQK